MAKQKGKKENPAKVGDKFITKNGVEVEIVLYNNYKDVLVSDGVLTRKSCVRDLRNGDAYWPTGPKLAPKPRKPHVHAPREDGLNNGLPKKYKAGAEFETERFGKFLITEVSQDGWLKVRFHNTGHEKSYKASPKFHPSIVNDDSLKATEEKPKYIRKHPVLSERWPVGSIHSSRMHGQFKILEVNGCLDIVIRWEDTGHIQTTTSSTLKVRGPKDESVVGNYLGAQGHYVYYAMHDGRIVYIGIGKGARYSHCTSGKSSCYYLNKLHFEKQQVSVGILIDKLSRDVVAALERYCILKILPEGNVAIPLQSVEEIQQNINRDLLDVMNARILEIQAEKLLLK